MPRIVNYCTCCKKGEPDFRLILERWIYIKWCVAIQVATNCTKNKGVGYDMILITTRPIAGTVLTSSIQPLISIVYPYLLVKACCNTTDRCSSWKCQCEVEYIYIHATTYFSNDLYELVRSTWTGCVATLSIYGVYPCNFSLILAIVPPKTTLYCLKKCSCFAIRSHLSFTWLNHLTMSFFSSISGSFVR